MEYFLIIVIIAAVAYIIYSAKQNKSKIQELQKQNQAPEEVEVTAEDINVIRYQRKFLLTKNEYYFYKKLKPIADELNLSVLAKIRLADIVEPQKGQSKSDWYKGFSKIKSKHIDFALCDPDNLMIKLAIELNDRSHNRADRQQRDIFVEKIFESVNIPFLQTYGGNELKQQIEKYIKKEAI